MRSNIKDLTILALVTIVSTFAVWLPFYFGLSNRMLTVFANYDGPVYIVIAKTFYNKALIASSFSIPLPLEYYPAHLPLYPLLIRLFDLILPTAWAMLSVTLVSTILAVCTFYLLIKKFKLSTSPFTLSLFFLFLPARWLVVHSVGSPEPLFIFTILASLYFFKSAFDKKQNNLFSPFKSVTFDFFLAGFFGALAIMTKTPGILLFISYLLFLCYNFLKTKQIIWKAWPILLIPVALLGVFAFYARQQGDFLAYFHSGDNFHLVFPPFQSFMTGRNWLGDFWLEDMVYVYLIGALAVILLFQKKLYIFTSFAFVFFTATLFIAHRDLSRYSLPLMPFALIAFAPFLEKKEFKIVFFFILIPVYLYTINFIAHNTAPIADWKPYF
ncbi:MAG: hypothetical protein Q8Q24_00820 [bacterium]|nr:hypothetical protein [bacterium]